jgi:hypothetical protein
MAGLGRGWVSGWAVAQGNVSCCAPAEGMPAAGADALATRPAGELV